MCHLLMLQSLLNIVLYPKKYVISVICITSFVFFCRVFECIFFKKSNGCRIFLVPGKFRRHSFFIMWLTETTFITLSYIKRWVLGCLHTTSGAATGDNNVFRYSYVKTLYLAHYKRSGASGGKRNAPEIEWYFLPLAATELGKFPMEFSLKKFHRKLICTGK